MKKLIVTCIGIALYTISLSQNFEQHRYAQHIFSQADTIKDVEYGTAPWLNNLIDIPGINTYNIHEGEETTETRPLLMDIFKPKDDTVSKKPAIVFVHGGAFLLGTRHNEDMIALCDSFAKMGYVSTSIEYRLGVGAQVERILGAITSIEVNENNFARSVYRGVQDGRAAIRFLKANATTYGIDTTRIYMVGSSAGGFISIHNIYMDKNSEIPDAAKTTPNLGLLDEIGISGYNSNAYAIVPYWGAIQNLSLIETNTTPALFIHGTADDTVPFKKGIPLNSLVPSNAILTFSLPETYGSYCIDTTLTNIDINHDTYFVESAGHEFYGVDNGDFPDEGPNAYWDTVINKTNRFLFQQHKPTANFSYVIDTFTVKVTNKSQDGIYFKWLFGDSQESTDENPSHTYSVSGLYQVKLIVQNQHQAWDTISQTIEIKEAENFQNIIFIIKHDTLPIKDAKVSLEGYGDLYSDSVGIVVFPNILTPDTINYTVSANNYLNYTDSIIISETNVEKIVQLQPEVYNVTFEITTGSNIYEGATVTLSEYGTRVSDSTGKAYFENVSPNDSIYYEVLAEGYSTQTGRIAVTDNDVIKTIVLSISKYTVKFYVAIDKTPVENAVVTFLTYGTLKTNINGEAIFNDVLPGIGLTYSVDVPGYSLFEGALIVSNSDVSEKIIFAAPSYTVLFDISLNDGSYEGVEVYLEGYGTSYTNKYGIARYLNVLPENNIFYEIKAERHGSLTGGVNVSDRDVSVIVEFTGINNNKKPALDIFPNPASEYFEINVPENGTLTMVNTSGKTILTKHVKRGTKQIHLKDIRNGIYFLKFASKKSILVNKLIVN